MMVLVMVFSPASEPLLQQGQHLIHIEIQWWQLPCVQRGGIHIGPQLFHQFLFRHLLLSSLSVPGLFSPGRLCQRHIPYPTGYIISYHVKKRNK